MTGLVWLNFPIIALVFLAIVGIPLWMTFRYPEKHPDYAQARAYFANEARRLHAATSGPTAASGLAAARQHAAAQTPVPGRAHSVPQQAARRHVRVSQDETDRAEQRNRS